MERVLIVLALVLFSGSLAFAQELSCESHHDGDALVSVCTYGDHKSVTRCDTDGCTSSSSNDAAAHISNATYRKLCQDGMSSACEELVGKVELDEKYGSDDAKELRLNKEVVSAYWLREKAKRNAKITELCQKGAYDKAYCDEFKAKQIAESKEITPSKVVLSTSDKKADDAKPVASTQDNKADDEKTARRMKEARECLKDHDAHAWCAIYDKTKK